MASEARARLGLAALLAITLASFAQLFERGNYPGPGLLALLAASALAIGARRLGLGTIVTLLLSLAGLVWYLAFLFEARHSFYGLPTPAAIAGVYGAVMNAYAHVNQDYAPIPVRPGYVVMIVTGLWLAATIGEVAAFRWKRSFLAALPCICLFATILVVGTGTGAALLMAIFLTALLTFWGLESSHRIRTWGRWVPTWAGHEDEEPASVAGDIGRKMAASTLVLAMLSPLFLPAVGEGLLRWRSGFGAGTGPGSGRIDPFVSIAPTLLRQTDTPLFAIRATEPTYWQLVALPNFDGRTWKPLAGEQTSSVDQPLVGPQPEQAPATELQQEVRIIYLQGNALPAANQAREISLISGIDPEAVTFGVETGNLKLDGEVDRDQTYVVSSLVADASFDELESAQVGDLGDIYTYLPEPLSEQARRLLAEWTADATTPLQELIAIQEHLRTDFSYSTAAASTGDGAPNPLDAFLFGTQAGICQQFASAFATMARSRGYPARVVVGFLPGERSIEADDEWLVRGTDAHAWPEIYFEDYGWVRFEPTPRSEGSRVALTPRYTTPPAGGDAGQGQGDETPGGGGDGFIGQLSLENPRDGVLDPGRGTGANTRLPTEPRAPAPWERTFRAVAVTLGVLTLAFLAFVPALKELVVRSRYRRASGARALAAAAFADFAQNAGDLAAVRRSSESARAYVLRVGELRGLPEAPLLRLADLSDAAEYAPDDLPEARAREARGLARELRRRLWSASAWGPRLVRLFSPRAALAGTRIAATLAR